MSSCRPRPLTDPTDPSTTSRTLRHRSALLTSELTFFESKVAKLLGGGGGGSDDSHSHSHSHSHSRSRTTPPPPSSSSSSTPPPHTATSTSSPSSSSSSGSTTVTTGTTTSTISASTLDDFRLLVSDLSRALSGILAGAAEYETNQAHALRKYKSMETRRVIKLRERVVTLMARWRECAGALRRVLKEKEVLGREREILMNSQGVMVLHQMLRANTTATSATSASNLVEGASMHDEDTFTDTDTDTETEPGGSRARSGGANMMSMKEFLRALLCDLVVSVANVLNCESGELHLFDVANHEFVQIVPLATSTDEDTHNPSVVRRFSADRGVAAVVFATGRPRNLSRGYERGGGRPIWRDVGSRGGAVIGTDPEELRNWRERRRNASSRDGGGGPSSSSAPPTNPTKKRDDDEKTENTETRFGGTTSVKDHDAFKKSLLCYPLVSRRTFTSIGLIEMSNKRGAENFSREDEAIMACFAVMLSRIVQSVIEIGLYQDLFGSGTRTVDFDGLHERMKLPQNPQGTQKNADTQLRFQDIVMPRRRAVAAGMAASALSSSSQGEGEGSSGPSSSSSGGGSYGEMGANGGGRYAASGGPDLSVLNEFGSLIPPHIEEFIRLLHAGWKQAVDDCAAYEKSNVQLVSKHEEKDVFVLILKKKIRQQQLRIDELEKLLIGHRSRQLLRIEDSGLSGSARYAAGPSPRSGVSTAASGISRVSRSRGRVPLSHHLRLRAGRHLPNIRGKKGLSSSLPIRMDASQKESSEFGDGGGGTTTDRLSPRVVSLAELDGMQTANHDEIYSQVFLRFPVPSVILSCSTLRVLKANSQFLELVKAKSSLETTGEFFTKFCTLSLDSLRSLFEHSEISRFDIIPIVAARRRLRNRKAKSMLINDVTGEIVHDPSKRTIRAEPIRCDLKVTRVGEDLGQEKAEAGTRLGYFRVNRRAVVLQEGPFYLVCCIRCPVTVQ